MRRSYDRAIWIAIAIIFAAFVSSHGTPALRHDWLWPVDRQDFVQVLRDSFSGWSVDGIGNPSSRMLDFIVNLPVAVIGLVSGPMVALFVWSFLVACTIGYGARRLCWALNGDDYITMFGATVLSTFNPWVYDHLVAGHMHMLLAMGATMGLLSHAIQPVEKTKPHDTIGATLLIAFAMAQLQFFLIDAPIVAVISLRRKTALPAVGYAVAALPTLVGVAANFTDLSQTLYTRPWEEAQSVSSNQSWFLSGYFAGYDDALPAWSLLALKVTIASLLCGAAVALRKATLIVAGIAVGCIGVVSGQGNAVGRVALQAMDHVAMLRVYRELDDLVGFLVIAYVALYALSINDRRLRGAVALLSVVAAAGWVASPPGHWWIDGRQVPKLDVSRVAPNSRFALFPAYQPLAFRGWGAGVDVQTMHSSTKSPVNEYLPLYPTSVALSSYRYRQDPTLLEALSVSTIFLRGYYSSVAVTIAPEGRRKYRTSSVELHHYVPMFSTCVQAALGALDSNFGACNEFIGDLPHRGLHVEPLVAPVNSTTPGKSWIDARTMFAKNPTFGQAFGGVYTTGSAPLKVVGRAVLASIAGSLSTATGHVFKGRGQYAWIDLGSNTSYLRCHGTCVVAAAGDRMPATTVPLNPPRQRFKATTFDRILPWLAVGDPPPKGILRFNERFEPGWIALDRCGIMTHIRLDAVVNGWILPVCSQRRALLVFLPAAVQFPLALAATAFFTILFLLRVRKFPKLPALSIRRT